MLSYIYDVCDQMYFALIESWKFLVGKFDQDYQE